MIVTLSNKYLDDMLIDLREYRRTQSNAIVSEISAGTVPAVWINDIGYAVPEIYFTIRLPGGTDPYADLCKIERDFWSHLPGGERHLSIRGVGWTYTNVNQNQQRLFTGTFSLLRNCNVVEAMVTPTTFNLLRP